MDGKFIVEPICDNRVEDSVRRNEILRRFCSNDITKPSICKPFVVALLPYATDGRIAIRFDVVSKEFEDVPNTDPRSDKAAHIEYCIYRDLRDAKEGRREALPIDFTILRRAAMAALDDTRATARADGVPEKVEDPDELTRKETAELSSCVILPGRSRMVIDAKYALLVCDTVSAFGACSAFAYLPTKRKFREKHGRILFAGARYDILLMAPRTDIPFDRGAIADAATGELVHRAEDKDPFDMDLLRFGKGGAE